MALYTDATSLACPPKPWRRRVSHQDIFLAANKERMLRKLTSLILLHFFTCTALLTFPLAEAGAKPVNNEALPNLNNISVPYHLGFITSSHDAPGAEKMVIHIRDAHCNYSSQKNIAAILQDLTTYNNLRLIGVEGAEKWINTALLSAIPGKEKRENVIEGLLSETVIHGSVAFAAKQENTEAMLFGIETKKLYIDNLQSHAELFINRKGALAQINKLKQELPGLAPLSKNKDISFAEGIGLIEKLLKISLTRNEYNKLIKNKLTFNSYLSLISEYSGSQGAGLTTVYQPDTLK